jgi:RimJ/RimL family protein N-acetyltransferase
MPNPTHSGDDAPIGVRVETTPALRPQRTALQGRLVKLVPLDVKIHGEALYQSTRGEAGEQLWTYLFEGPFPDRVSFEAHLLKIASSDDPMFFAITDAASGSALGYASYMRIEPIHRVIEVGSILFTPRLQQTAMATEAMYLMARNVFDDLNYRRYEWKCNALNAPSRKAALRLGFSFEGIFRQHMVVKGRNRDTAWFSMLDSEWPAKKANFERWLDPSNFDGSGKQKVSLSDLNRQGNANSDIR